jgi:hypothetical protein
MRGGGKPAFESRYGTPIAKYSPQYIQAPDSIGQLDLIARVT